MTITTHSDTNSDTLMVDCINMRLGVAGLLRVVYPEE